MKRNPLEPASTLLCKLGSIAVHVEEGLSKDGHPFDLVVLQQLLGDAEVRTWLDAMAKMALLPVKRGGKR